MIQRIFKVDERLCALEFDLLLVLVDPLAVDGYIPVLATQLPLVDLFYLLCDCHHGREVDEDESRRVTPPPELFDGHRATESVQDQPARCRSD